MKEKRRVCNHSERRGADGLVMCQRPLYPQRLEFRGSRARFNLTWRRAKRSSTQDR